MKKMLLTLGSLVLAVAGVAWGALNLSNSRSIQVAGELVTRVETTDSVVALTFDDGPIPIYTDSVLAILAEFQIPATFFMVGERMERAPDVVARVRAQGHELANHSYSHPALILKRPSIIRSQVEATDSIIRAMGHEGEIWFRPPYGKRLLGLPLYLARKRRPVVLWDLEPDTYWLDAAEVVDHVEAGVQPGSIILLHVELPVRKENRIALRILIPSLLARGYKFVTVTDLMQRSVPPTS